jgi:hypothetical protein
MIAPRRTRRGFFPLKVAGMTHLRRPYSELKHEPARQPGYRRLYQRIEATESAIEFLYRQVNELRTRTREFDARLRQLERTNGQD